MFEKIEIKIEYTEKDKWSVSYKDRRADHLMYEEMLGLIASITMPKVRPCLQWLEKIQ